MKNSLEKFIAANRLNPDAAMNHLQDCGLISDQAVIAADVAESDCQEACVELSKKFKVPFIGLLF